MATGHTYPNLLARMDEALLLLPRDLTLNSLVDKVDTASFKFW